MCLFNLFGRKAKNKNEFKQLDASCSTAFKDVFSRCRFDFGREMVEIMDLKPALMEKLNNPDKITPAQGLIAKKLLELMCVYLRTADTYVSIKKGKNTDEESMTELEGIKDKIGNVYSLINKLNKQFYLCSDDMSGTSESNEIINEAEALLTVTKNMYKQM